MLASIAILTLFFLSGYALLWAREFRFSGAVRPVLSVLVGVPLTIVLASFLLLAEFLTLGSLIVTVVLFVLVCLFVIPPLMADPPGKILSVRNLVAPVWGHGKLFRHRAMLHYVLLVLDLVIFVGICISSFYIRNGWQGDTNAPDVWAHINWANKLATTGSHNFTYMPGMHILIWLVSEIFGCSIYTAGVNLPVFFTIYLALVTYFAGTWAFNRTTGLMLTLVYLASPALSLTYNSTLVLPRNLAHGFFLLGLLLTARAMAGTIKRHASSLIASGAVIGMMVVTHLAYDELLGGAGLILTLIVIVVLYRNKFVHVGVLILTALVVVVPYMSKMVYRKLQPESYFNISPDRLIPFTAAQLFRSIFPATIWVGVASLTIFLILWVCRSRLSLLRLDKKISISRTRILKAAILATVCTCMSAVSYLLLLCIGKQGIEPFVCASLPLPHPINTDHFFTMLAFGLLGGVGMVGYLPACLKGKWKLPTIGILVLVFALILALPQITAKDNVKTGFIFADSIPMWLLLALATVLTDYRTCILSKVKNSKLITSLAIIAISFIVGISMPSTQPIRRFVLQAPEFEAEPTKLQQWIIQFSSKDAVVLSHWPYLDSLEYVLDRRIADGLLGPGAFWSLHRPGLPGKYWHMLKFVENRIANNPEEIVEALHADFGPEVYLYFRVERHSPFLTHRRYYHELTPYTSEISKEIYGKPPVKYPKGRFMSMIAYFQAHNQYFKKIGQDNRSVLFKLIK